MNEQIIKDAITHSISHNEIVRVSIAGDFSDMSEAITSATASEWDTSEENDGSYDCYSVEFGDFLPDWRINVTFV